MILAHNSKEVTIFNYKKALEACKGQVSGTYKKPLSYVGTYYETPLIEKSILAEPHVEAEFLKDTKGVRLQIILKPDADHQKTQVELLDQVLGSLGSGRAFDRYSFKIGVNKAKPTIINRFLTQNTAFSEVQNYELEVNLESPVVRKSEFMINKTRYYQYSLTEKYYVDKDEVFYHTVYSLFKEKTSDLESFYSTFVNKKLDKRATKYVLDSISENNISGYSILGYQIESIKDNSLHIDSYSLASDIELSSTEATYYIRGSEGGVHVGKEYINNLKVEYTNQNAYTLSFNTSMNKISLFLG